MDAALAWFPDSDLAIGIACDLLWPAHCSLRLVTLPSSALPLL